MPTLSQHATKLQQQINLGRKSVSQKLERIHICVSRKMFDISPAFVSRVSNATVFSKAEMRPISELILQRQLLLLGKAAMSPADAPLRRATFTDDGLIPQVGRHVRPVGRPRLAWTTEVLKIAEARLGYHRVRHLLANRGTDAERIRKQEAQGSFEPGSSKPFNQTIR